MFAAVRQNRVAQNTPAVIARCHVAAIPTLKTDELRGKILLLFLFFFSIICHKGWSPICEVCPRGQLSGWETMGSICDDYTDGIRSPFRQSMSWSVHSKKASNPTSVFSRDTGGQGVTQTGWGPRLSQGSDHLLALECGPGCKLESVCSEANTSVAIFLSLLFCCFIAVPL